jgi:Zn-dependent protease with chaperone function
VELAGVAACPRNSERDRYARAMTSRLRKLTLTAHVTISVGWLGAVLAYLALAIAAVASGDPRLVRAAFLSMEVIGWYVIVSCSVGALITGLVQSLGTPWGLFRHHWIVAKLILTVGATLVLVKHMPTVSRVVERATAGDADPGMVQVQLLVHAAGGLVVLIAITALSIAKPWGRTAYGRRKQLGERAASEP